MDNEQVFGVVPNKLPPDRLDRVSKILLSEQSRAVKSNQPYRGRFFRKNGGWLALKIRGTWHRAQIYGEVHSQDEDFARFNNFSVLDVDLGNGSISRFLTKLDEARCWELFSHTFSLDWLNDMATRLDDPNHWSNVCDELEMIHESNPEHSDLFETIRQSDNQTI